MEIQTQDYAELEILRKQAEAHPDCQFCKEVYAKGQSFSPRHTASRNCESGKHPHCTCDTCF